MVVRNIIRALGPLSFPVEGLGEMSFCPVLPTYILGTLLINAFVQVI